MNIGDLLKIKEEDYTVAKTTYSVIYAKDGNLFWIYPPVYDRYNQVWRGFSIKRMDPKYRDHFWWSIRKVAGHKEK